VLKETVPRITRVMMIMHPETPIQQAFWRSLEEAAPRFGVEARSGGVHDAAEIERAITSFVTKENGGIIVTPHALTWANEDLIIALTLQHRLYCRVREGRGTRLLRFRPRRCNAQNGGVC
jgi:putative tryptophan/tyrosine transport system substrate-binding protein